MPQTRIHLARHITMVLIVKTVALYGLWAAFFSNPVPVDAGAVSNVVAGPGQPDRKGQ